MVAEHASSPVDLWEGEEVASCSHGYIWRVYFAKRVPFLNPWWHISPLFENEKERKRGSNLRQQRLASPTAQVLQCIQKFFPKLCLTGKEWFLTRFPPNFQERFLMSSASPEFVFWGPKIKQFCFKQVLVDRENIHKNLNSGLELKITTRKENWGKKMASGVFPENLRKIERETNVL